MMMMMMMMVMMTMLPGLLRSGDDDVLVSLISLVRDDSLGPHIVRWPQWTPNFSVHSQVRRLRTRAGGVGGTC